MIILLCSRLLQDVLCSCGTLFFLNIFVSDVCGDDRSDSDSGSESIEGSDEDGFMEEDDDGNMVMIYQTMTGSTQILFSCTTHVCIC